MGYAAVNYDEIRFDVRDPELTHVYVMCTAIGDCPLGVQGWHHKAFSANLSTRDILNEHMWIPDDKETDPVMWPQKAPRSMAGSGE